MTLSIRFATKCINIQITNLVCVHRPHNVSLQRGLSYINVNVKFIEVESGHFCVKVTKKLMILVCHN